MHVKFNIHSNKDISFVVGLVSLIGCNKAILSNDNENGCVNERHQEHISHHTDVVRGDSFISHVISHKIEDVSDDNVDKSNPHSKDLSFVHLNISDRSPRFAVLLTVGEQNVISRVPIEFEQLLTVAVHLAQLILVRLKVVKPDLIIGEDIFYTALRLSEVFQALSNELPVVLTTVAEYECSNNGSEYKSSVIDV